MKKNMQEYKVPLIVGALVIIALLIYVYQDKLASFFLNRGESLSSNPVVNTGSVSTSVGSGSSSNSNYNSGNDTILKKGSSGVKVEELQNMLNVKHSNSGPTFYLHLVADGQFGTLTENMLKKYTGKTSISINELIKALK